MARRQSNIDDIEYAINNGDPRNEQVLLMQEAMWGIRDTESDLYIFNVNGISGTFFFGENNEILFTKKQDFKVEKVNNYASAWILTDASGNRYYFGSNKEGSKSAIEFTESYSTGSLPSDSRSTIAAWYITEIEDVTQENKIEFNYRAEQSTSEYRSREQYTQQISSIDCSESDFGYRRYSTISFVEAAILESITSRHQKIEFIADFERANLNSMLNGRGTAAKALTKILVSDLSGNSIKEFGFSYSYFPINAIVAYSGALESEDLRSQKLRLDQVQEKNKDLVVPPHKFEYNSQNIPERFSFQMDFWGFYNGRARNDAIRKLIPEIEVKLDININSPLSLVEKFEGANRLPDQEYMKAGILEKIIYPTGGFTEFDYEANTTIDTQKFPKGYRNEYVLKNERMEALENSLNPITEQVFEINTIREPEIAEAITFLNWNIENLDCQGEFGTLSCGVEIRIESITDPTFTPFILREEIGNVPLKNGSYKMVCVINSDSNPNTTKTASIKYNWKEGQETMEKMAGGLRIKMVKSYASESANPIVKQYEYKTENGLSSGRMATELKNVHYPSSFPFCRYLGIYAFLHQPLSYCKYARRVCWI